MGTSAFWSVLPCRVQGRVPGQWFPPPFTAAMDVTWMAPGVPVAHSYNLKPSFSYRGAEHMGIFGSELAVEAHKIILYSGSSHRHRWFSRIQLCCQLFFLYSHWNRW